MNEAVQLVDKYASQFAEAIKDVAPHVYIAAYKATISNAIGCLMIMLVFFLVFLTAGIILFKVWQRLKSRLSSNSYQYEKNNAYTVLAFGINSYLISGIFLAGAINSILTFFYRLDWYTIHRLTKLIPGGG